MSVETLLEVEIQDEFEKLSKMEVGTETHKTAVDGLTKLLEKAIEIDKNDSERKAAEEAREFERNLKLMQLQEDKKDRWCKNILSGLGIALPLGVTIWGTLKSLKFEQDGTVTTIVGRGFINKLLPKK